MEEVVVEVEVTVVVVAMAVVEVVERVGTPLSRILRQDPVGSGASYVFSIIN